MTEKKNDEWDEFIKSVNPINKNIIKPSQKVKTVKISELTSQKAVEKINLENIEIPDEKFEYQKNTDQNLIRKVRRRQKKIEGTLDLHGLKVYEAKTKVFQFIRLNFEKRNRLLLIITGKGKRLGVEYGWRGRGILKELAVLVLRAIVKVLLQTTRIGVNLISLDLPHLCEILTNK